MRYRPADAVRLRTIPYDIELILSNVLVRQVPKCSRVFEREDSNCCEPGFMGKRLDSNRSSAEIQQPCFISDAKMVQLSCFKF